MPGGSPPLPTSSPSLIARCWQRARCAGALRIVLSEELRVRHAALSARTRRASSCIYVLSTGSAWKSGASVGQEGLSVDLAPLSARVTPLLILLGIPKR